jgi:hypothetical protein
LLAVTVCLETGLFEQTESAEVETPSAPLAPAPVFLGDATYFAILSKSGITERCPLKIVDDIGTSLITGAAIHDLRRYAMGRPSSAITVICSLSGF